MRAFQSVTIICSRCGKVVDGLVSARYGTGGYYPVETGIWAKYADVGETELCDECMWADPRYQKDYPGSPDYGDDTLVD